jgi:hypothetical protein
MPTTIEGLPNEVILETAHWLEPEQCFYPNSKKDLMAVNLVSRQFHHVVPKILFRSMELYFKPGQPKLQRFLIKKPDLVKYVQRVQMTLPPTITLEQYDFEHIQEQDVNAPNVWLHGHIHRTMGLPLDYRRVRDEHWLLEQEYYGWFIEPFREDYRNLPVQSRAILQRFPQLRFMQGAMRKREEYRFPAKAMAFARRHGFDPRVVHYFVDEVYAKVVVSRTLCSMWRGKVTGMRLDMFPIKLADVRPWYVESSIVRPETPLDSSYRNHSIANKLSGTVSTQTTTGC